jgi:HD-like signal output (HDOD) protein
VAQAAHQDKSAADTAFVAGLLHDTGKLVLGSTVTDHYRKVLQIVGQENRLIWEVEREVLGTTHAEVGAYLIGLWGLDEAVVEALAYHHRPSECRRQDFGPLAAVHVANVLEHELCVIHDDYARPELDATFLTRTSLHDKVERWRNLYRQVAAGHDAA